MYNYSKALPTIQSTGVVILVESPGNVWRLAEAGIKNAVAIFGTALNVDQRKLLDESGAINILLMMDNDDAGEQAKIKIIEQCKTIYHVDSIDWEGIPFGDIGEMKVSDVHKHITPLVDKHIASLKGFFE